MLAAAGRVTRRDVDDLLLIGALSLDGAIQPARGVLPVAASARRNGYRGLLLPLGNQPEAAVVSGLRLYGVTTLSEAVHAVIVCKPGANVAADEIKTHCRALIATYKCPRSVELRDALPLSGAGKVLKTVLREPFWEGRQRRVG